MEEKQHNDLIEMERKKQPIFLLIVADRAGNTQTHTHKSATYIEFCLLVINRYLILSSCSSLTDKRLLSDCFALKARGDGGKKEGRDGKLRRKQTERERESQVNTICIKKEIIFEDRKRKREIKQNKTERLRKKRIRRLRLGKCYHTLTAPR